MVTEGPSGPGESLGSTKLQIFVRAGRRCVRLLEVEEGGSVAVSLEAEESLADCSTSAGSTTAELEEQCLAVFATSQEVVQQLQRVRALSGSPGLFTYRLHREEYKHRRALLSKSLCRATGAP
eukprot:scaffold94_cov340-Prasinococcus_capsulatus_cf.AAC.9